jgi:hypothetical protein
MRGGIRDTIALEGRDESEAIRTALELGADDPDLTISGRPGGGNRSPLASNLRGMNPVGFRLRTRSRHGDFIHIGPEHRLPKLVSRTRALRVDADPRLLLLRKRQVSPPANASPAFASMQLAAWLALVLV